MTGELADIFYNHNDVIVHVIPSVQHCCDRSYSFVSRGFTTGTGRNLTDVFNCQTTERIISRHDKHVGTSVLLGKRHLIWKVIACSVWVRVWGDRSEGG